MGQYCFANIAFATISTFVNPKISAISIYCRYPLLQRPFISAYFKIRPYAVVTHVVNDVNSICQLLVRTATSILDVTRYHNHIVK